MLQSVRLPRDSYSAWVELHIEQGPLLERDGIDIGIVTAIAAPASYRYTVEGLGGHAGALLMPDRRDALCAAAEIVLAVERHARAANAESARQGGSGVDSVATVGMLAVHPGAVNSVPSRVTASLDIRDTDVARRDRSMAGLRDDIADIEQNRGVRITEEIVNADAPATSDPAIVTALEEACRAEGASFSAHGQPRLSRHQLHGEGRSSRHAVHPLPRRRLPPAGRMELARGHRAGHARARPHPRSPVATLTPGCPAKAVRQHWGIRPYASLCLCGDRRS